MLSDLDVFSVLAYTQHELAFVMQFIGEFGVVKGSVGLKQCTFWLHEYNRFVRYVIAKFLGVIRIIAANTNDLHESVFLR